MLLNLGCGTDRKRDYLNCDLYVQAERRLDAVTLEGVGDGTVRGILAEHLLEHLGHRQAEKALKRWFIAMASGADLTVIVPDAARFVRAWLESPGDVGLGECVWGNQLHEGDYHRWGYTEETLRAALEHAGFRVKKLERTAGRNHATRDVEPNACIRAEAVKP